MNARVYNDTTLMLGLDFGSTTAKAVVLSSEGDVLFSSYGRHYSDAAGTAIRLLREINGKFPEAQFRIAVSGSSGMGLSEAFGLHFEQEVIAATAAIREALPKTDVAIELGGEDAKITFLAGSMEQRMNETCAGGTGAFIDQMADYLKTDAAGLDALAAKGKPQHIIASRCGVFARTDVVLLLNEGASREDIAASIFQSVVNQTISGLACGRAIKGHVAFLGGPLHYLPMLRQRFIETLGLTEEETLTSEHGHLFVAYGSALASESQPPQCLATLLECVENHRVIPQKSAVLPALFADDAERETFKARHAKEKVKRRELSGYAGDIYLGIDMGSTTLKAVATDPEGNVLYTYYNHTSGEPLNSAIAMFRDLYAALPAEATIVRCGSTGYGAALLKEIFGADFDEVETAAHCRAAAEFQPGASFLLDIGGQDMKCIYLKNGEIDRVFLNEACSSGCGVFIETLSKSLQLEKDAFFGAASTGEHPIDLGTRCTVFMNSKVRQAQKEGATVGDIAAGLVYAVVRNALHKVIKVASPEDLGEKIVVQGGSFYNDALLRAFELSVGREVCRPDIAGLMGAYGMALFAIEEVAQGAKRGSTLITRTDAQTFTYMVKEVHCERCPNRCRLQVSTASNGYRHIYGNRCERGAGIGKTESADIPNLYDYKYQRLFAHYTPLDIADAPRGRIGLLRALNMYENYPFWFTLLTRLGYRVELSAESSQKIFQKGSATIPSQTVCYPAKLAHGHVIELIERGVDTILFPCILYEHKEYEDSHGHFNCPVVAGYPELLRLNLDILEERGITFHTPFLPLDNGAKLAETLSDMLGIATSEILAAYKVAVAEQETFKTDMRIAAENALAYIEEKNIPGIVLAGHPYHIDPEVHHGIPAEIVARGCAVLTEDSIAHTAPPVALRVTDQWTYHSRLYRAAAVAHPNLYLIQLTSFGCGLDALTSDQVQEIVESDGKPYTLLKLDEGANLGAARIRIRSLLRAIKTRKERMVNVHPPASSLTREKRETILIPQLSPIHLALLEPAMQASGYNVKVLEKVDKGAIELGLRYVNNDACYPALMVIGQLIQALKSGEYDLDKTAVMLPRTGGSCRATNYTAMMEKALRDSGLQHVAILPLEFRGVEGIWMTVRMLPKSVAGLILGDLITRLLYRVRPYEVTAGKADATAKNCVKYAAAWLRGKRKRSFKTVVKLVVSRFAKIAMRDERRRPRVGIVGEILVKYHPDANNHLVDVIEHEGGEVVSSDMLTFLMYCLHDDIFSSQALGKNHFLSLRNRVIINILEHYRNKVREALKPYPQFDPPPHVYALSEAAERLTSLGLQAGEGWLITGESLELFDQGVTNVLSVQPFGCLANHICAKGMMKALRQCDPHANIAAIDYDPGASEVNQINRIRLFMTAAKENERKKRDAVT